MSTSARSLPIETLSSLAPMRTRTHSVRTTYQTRKPVFSVDPEQVLFIRRPFDDEGVVSLSTATRQVLSDLLPS